MTVKDKYLFLRKEFPAKSATEAIKDARWWESWFAALREKKVLIGDLSTASSKLSTDDNPNC